MRNLLLIVAISLLGGCSTMTKLPKSPEKTPAPRVSPSSASRQVEKDRVQMAKMHVEGGLVR